MANRLLEVSANSTGYLQIHFNRKFLGTGQTLNYAQIVSSTSGYQIGQRYNPNLTSAADDHDDLLAEVDGPTPAHLDFSHAAACKAANDAIVERDMALQKGIKPGVDPVPDVVVGVGVGATSSRIITPLLTLPKTNGGTIPLSYKVQYPTHYYIVGYDNNKVIVSISQHPCRDPSDAYFELISKSGKFVLGWDNEHCYYDGYVALYNYEPAIGSNPADLDAYQKYQWTTKGSSYNTGVTDDGKQWYAALCTWNYSTKAWAILRVVGVVESVEMWDLTYDHVTNKSLTTVDQQTFSVLASNSSTAPITTECTQSFTLEQSYSWSSSLGARISVTWTVTTGIPYILPTGSTVNAEGSMTWDSSTTNTVSQTVAVAQSLEVQPNSQNLVTFQSIIGGVTNLAFRAKTRSNCRAGETFDSPTRNAAGTYTGALINRIMVDVGPTHQALPSTTADRPAAVAVEEAPPQQQHIATAVEDNGSTKQQVFAVEADTIYWYYVDENGHIHPASNGI